VPRGGRVGRRLPGGRADAGSEGGGGPPAAHLPATRDAARGARRIRTGPAGTGRRACKAAAEQRRSAEDGVSRCGGALRLRRGCRAVRSSHGGEAWHGGRPSEHDKLHSWAAAAPAPGARRTTRFPPPAPPCPDSATACTARRAISATACSSPCPESLRAPRRVRLHVPPQQMAPHLTATPRPMPAASNQEREHARDQRRSELQVQHEERSLVVSLSRP
jgi:hypothetical protein